MKLELKHLAPYLPYRLNVVVDEWGVEKMIGCINNEVITSEDNADLSMVKPILRPLSDLSKISEKFATEHSINAFVSEKYNIDYGVFSHHKGELDIELDGDMYLGYDKNKSISFNVINDIQSELFKNHYDIYGLIEKGLAIDINTIDL